MRGARNKSWEVGTKLISERRCMIAIDYWLKPLQQCECKIVQAVFYCLIKCECSARNDFIENIIIWVISNYSTSKLNQIRIDIPFLLSCTAKLLGTVVSQSENRVKINRTCDFPFECSEFNWKVESLAWIVISVKMHQESKYIRRTHQNINRYGWKLRRVLSFTIGNVDWWIWKDIFSFLVIFLHAVWVGGFVIWSFSRNDKQMHTSISSVNYDHNIIFSLNI